MRQGFHRPAARLVGSTSANNPTRSTCQ